MNLSSNFTLEEMTHSDMAARQGWDNMPDGKSLANLIRTAQLLEKVRKAVGNKPITVTSGYRCKQLNDALGSKDTSSHRIGCAADIRVNGLKPVEVVQLCIENFVPFDQIILEFNSWVHISVPHDPDSIPRNQKLVIDQTGTRPYS